jgi:hypothetical protein
MPVVDRIASSGYSYVSPTVDKACKAVPVLDGIKQRIEPYPPLLIKKADVCVDTIYGVVEVRKEALRGAVNSAGSKALALKDTAYTVVEDRAAALRDVLTSTGGKAQKMIGENVVVVRVHKTSLALVDHLDMLIDRYLPEPESQKGKDDETCDNSPKGLIPRMLYIPYKIPIRMMHITIAKTSDAYDVIQVKIQWACDLTLEQKAKIVKFLLSQRQAFTDKVSSSSLAITLQQGRQGAYEKLQVGLQRLHVIEAKDWALTTAGALQQATVDRTSQVFVTGSQHVYDVTSLVVGQDRAMGIFTFVGKMFPFVKIAIHSSASTGALSNSDSASHEAEQEIDASTGATGTVPVADAPSTLTTDEKKV